VKHAIHKCILQPGLNPLNLPVGAKVLSVQPQHGQVAMWVLVDTNAGTQRQRVFHVYLTGEPINELPQLLEFIGTVQLSDGQFVVHVFEVTL
jgi:hypothetical protein